MYFVYGETEIEYLKRKDKKLGEAIDKIGHIHKSVDDNLFCTLIHHIIGQQISIKAQETIWNRMIENFGEVTAKAISTSSIDELQQFGTTFKKAKYMSIIANKVLNNELILEQLYEMDDDTVIKVLSELPGIGVWTAEMIMTFCMQRPDIFSFGDLAIHRGLRMLYHHRKVDKKLFEKYRRRYSPYGTVASLYLWEISIGAIPDMKDYAPKKKRKKKTIKKAVTE